MSTTTLTTPPEPSAVDQLPSFGDMLRAILPLIGVVAVAGPPVVFLAGPLVLFALMLTGPFVLAMTLVLAAAAAVVAVAALVALAGAIVAAPYRLVRHLRAHYGRHPHTGAAAAQRVAVEPRHVAA
jgi:hypothetical protein